MTMSRNSFPKQVSPAMKRPKRKAKAKKASTAKPAWMRNK